MEKYLLELPQCVFLFTINDAGMVPGYKFVKNKDMLLFIFQ